MDIYTIIYYLYPPIGGVRRHNLRKKALKIDDGDDTEASSTKQAFPLKETNKNIATPLVVQ